jgi:TusA-related sulfurtransferase
MLRKSLGPVASRTGDALSSILSFLSEAPPGEIIDILTDKEGAVGTQAIESLCDVTGGTVTGRYDIKKGKNAKQLEETVQVGPCYNQSNECLGRCGPGCGAPPDETVQRFTQDCLNHDLCTRATGKIFGQCRDEWIAAADDFLFGPDCGDVTDIWNDNFGYVWSLEQQSVINTITGSVEVIAPQCGTWSVQGTHVGSDIH